MKILDTTTLTAGATISVPRASQHHTASFHSTLFRCVVGSTKVRILTGEKPHDLPRQPLTLPFLRFVEAAVMPYAENTLSFDIQASLEKFLMSIVHVQARSISSISILYNWTYSRKMTLAKLTQHKLQNAENLVNFLELDAGITAKELCLQRGDERWDGIVCTALQFT